MRLKEAWKEAHLTNITRPQQPVVGLFSALRSSPVRQCMLAALHMSIHAYTLRMCRFTLAMAICRASRTFSAMISGGDKIPWGGRVPDVYGPHHTCASCLVLG